MSQQQEQDTLVVSGTDKDPYLFIDNTPLDQPMGQRRSDRLKGFATGGVVFCSAAFGLAAGQPLLDHVIGDHELIKKGITAISTVGCGLVSIYVGHTVTQHSEKKREKAELRRLGLG